jgi:hypothetical protein
MSSKHERRKNVMHLNDTMAAAQAMNAGLDVYGGWDDNLWGDGAVLFSGRNAHLRMPLSFTPLLRLKRCHACDQCHSSWMSTPLTGSHCKLHPNTEGHLASAVNESLTNEATITKAVERTLMQKLKVGLFDPLEGDPWVKLALDDMNNTHAQQVAHEAALQSFVLLKNDASTLPLKLGVKVVVVGPLADTASEYNSDYAVAGMPPNSPSIADAVFALNAAHGGHGARVSAEVCTRGCHWFIRLLA